MKEGLVDIMTWILLLGVFVIGYFLIDFISHILSRGMITTAKKRKKNVGKHQKGSASLPVAPVAPSVPEPMPSPSPNEIEVPLSLGGSRLAYKYEDVNIFVPDALNIDFPSLELGHSVSFRAERDNPYDNDAIAVYNNGDKLGYLYRGKIRDMVYDFHARGDLILSWIKAVDDDEHIVKLLIAFYR